LSRGKQTRPTFGAILAMRSRRINATSNLLDNINK
jgi:hypothetical protein